METRFGNTPVLPEDYVALQDLDENMFGNLCIKTNVCIATSMLTVWPAVLIYTLCRENFTALLLGLMLTVLIAVLTCKKISQSFRKSDIEQNVQYTAYMRSIGPDALTSVQSYATSNGLTIIDVLQKMIYAEAEVGATKVTEFVKSSNFTQLEAEAAKHQAKITPIVVHNGMY